MQRTLQRKDSWTLEITSHIHLQYSLALKLVYVQLSLLFPILTPLSKTNFYTINFFPKNSLYKNIKRAQATQKLLKWCHITKMI